jgi:hypothetical protein
MKMRVILVMEYEADPSSYGTDDVIKMSNIDEEGFSSNMDVLFDTIQNGECEIVVDSPWNGFIKNKGKLVSS